MATITTNRHGQSHYPTFTNLYNDMLVYTLSTARRHAVTFQCPNITSPLNRLHYRHNVNIKHIKERHVPELAQQPFWFAAQIPCQACDQPRQQQDRSFGANWSCCPQADQSDDRALQYKSQHLPTTQQNIRLTSMQLNVLINNRLLLRLASSTWCSRSTANITCDTHACRVSVSQITTEKNSSNTSLKDGWRQWTNVLSVVLCLQQLTTLLARRRSC